MSRLSLFQLPIETRISIVIFHDVFDLNLAPFQLLPLQPVLSKGFNVTLGFDAESIPGGTLRIVIPVVMLFRLFRCSDSGCALPHGGLNLGRAMTRNTHPHSNQ